MDEAAVAEVTALAAAAAAFRVAAHAAAVAAGERLTSGVHDLSLEGEPTAPRACWLEDFSKTLLLSPSPSVHWMMVGLNQELYTADEWTWPGLGFLSHQLVLAIDQSSLMCCHDLGE